MLRLGEYTRLDWGHWGGRKITKPWVPDNGFVSSFRVCVRIKAIFVWNERKFFRVGQVSQSSYLQLIFDEVGFGDKGDRHSFNFGLDPVSPDLVEGHFSDGGEYVDVVVLGAETEVIFLVEEIAGLEALERDSEREQSVECGACVVFGRPYKDVKVIGGAHIAVCIDGDPADDSVFNLCGDERGEE